ncbi:MAG TPA: glycosyltransferase [Candidatus Binataceae bacterium]|nr:glycosyltransferase [Candidatus Binataceae bacterium]
MTTKHPAVAAIIPVFNGARTIARAIDSVLADAEVRVSGGNSCDR